MTASAPDDRPVSTADFAKLTGFQRDLLTIIAGLDAPKGLAIKEELEQYYDEVINHGRLYPNLDTLVEDGFVEKRALDKRSNAYVLTSFGKRHLSKRYHWEGSQESNGATPASQGRETSPPQSRTKDPDRTPNGNDEVEARRTDTKEETKRETASREEADDVEDVLNDIEDAFDDIGDESSD